MSLLTFISFHVCVFAHIHLIPRLCLCSGCCSKPLVLSWCWQTPPKPCAELWRWPTSWQQRPLTPSSYSSSRTLPTRTSTDVRQVRGGKCSPWVRTDPLLLHPGAVWEPFQLRRPPSYDRCEGEIAVHVYVQTPNSFILQQFWERFNSDVRRRSTVGGGELKLWVSRAFLGDIFRA